MKKLNAWLLYISRWWQSYKYETIKYGVTRKQISELKLHIISYYKTIQVIIFIFNFFVAARIPVHAGLGIDERIGAASSLFPASWRLWLGVALSFVIIIL